MQESSWLDDIDFFGEGSSTAPTAPIDYVAPLPDNPEEAHGHVMLKMLGMPAHLLAKMPAKHLRHVSRNMGVKEITEEVEIVSSISGDTRTVPGPRTLSVRLRPYGPETETTAVNLDILQSLVGLSFIPHDIYKDWRDAVNEPQF